MKRLAMAVCAAALLAGCGEQKVEQAAAPQTPATAERPAANPLKNAYFGDLHLHTRNSFDAYIFNVRASPDEAYAYAKGGTIKHAAGFDMKLNSGPLDFLAVTDHSEYLGVLQAIEQLGMRAIEVPAVSRTGLDLDVSETAGTPHLAVHLDQRQARCCTASAPTGIGHRRRRKRLSHPSRRRSDRAAGRKDTGNLSAGTYRSANPGNHKPCRRTVQSAIAAWQDLEGSQVVAWNSGLSDRPVT